MKAEVLRILRRASGNWLSVVDISRRIDAMRHSSEAFKVGKELVEKGQAEYTHDTSLHQSMFRIK